MITTLVLEVLESNQGLQMCVKFGEEREVIYSASKIVFLTMESSVLYCTKNILDHLVVSRYSRYSLY